MNSQQSIADTAVYLSNDSLFFALPLEIRGYIYGMVFQDSTTKVAFLQINRQILSEAQAQLYRQPARFDSQHTFFAWLSRSAPDHLSHIQSLSLTIVDLDLSCLIGPHHGERPSLWDMYTDELEKLNDAFNNLPNLLDLTIKESGTSHSFLFEDFFRRVLKRLRSRLPKACSVNNLDDIPAESTENEQEVHGELAREEKSAEPLRGTTMFFSKDSLSPETESAESCRPFTARWHSDPSGLCKHLSSQQRRARGKAA